MANFKSLAFKFKFTYGMGAGMGDIQNNEYLITAMFQSRVYMIRKSIVKHIFFGIYSQNETAKKSKIHTSCFGYFSFKLKTLFLSGMIQYLVPTKLLT